MYINVIVGFNVNAEAVWNLLWVDLVTFESGAGLLVWCRMQFVGNAFGMRFVGITPQSRLFSSVGHVLGI
jgi:hypothetical protein